MINPSFVQKAENISIFIVSCSVYAQQGYSLVWFILLLFVFDISMIGYVVNNRVGAHTYNIVHNYVVPVVLVGSGVILSIDNLIMISLIWIAHISLDRALGYGLKHETSFFDTHLGSIVKHKNNKISSKSP